MESDDDEWERWSKMSIKNMEQGDDEGWKSDAIDEKDITTCDEWERYSKMRMKDRNQMWWKTCGMEDVARLRKKNTIIYINSNRQNVL